MSDKFVQMQRAASGTAIPPTPKVPTVPESIKARHPENRAAWEAYDAEWVEFFKQTGQIQS